MPIGTIGLEIGEGNGPRDRGERPGRCSYAVAVPGQGSGIIRRREARRAVAVGTGILPIPGAVVLVVGPEGAGRLQAVGNEGGVRATWTARNGREHGARVFRAGTAALAWLEEACS